MPTRLPSAHPRLMRPRRMRDGLEDGAAYAAPDDVLPAAALSPKKQRGPLPETGHEPAAGSSRCKLHHLGVGQYCRAARILHHRASRGEKNGGAVTDGTLRELASAGACVVSLCVPGVIGVASVSAVAATLRKLDASGACGIDDAGIAFATRLSVLGASNNPKIHSVDPFASTLISLNAGLGCGITDARLVRATRIRELDAYGNPKVTTVAPFGSTLRVLNCSDVCGIDDAGVANAPCIRELDASRNSKVTPSLHLGGRCVC